MRTVLLPFPPMLLATVLGLTAGGLAGCESAPDPNEQSPDVSTAKPAEPYRVRFETTKGDFTIKVRPEWAPRGAKRFRELVESGFFDGARFFRVIPGFMVQFGIAADPQVSAKWHEKTIPDDPVKQSNQRGYVTFAKTDAPNSRTTQVFINYGDNSRLDSDRFAPFGVVIQGMDVVDSLNAQYEGAPSEFQQQITEQGNAFLDEQFPGLDEIKRAYIIQEDKAPPDKAEADKTDEGKTDGSAADGSPSPAADGTEGDQ